MSFTVHATDGLARCATVALPRQSVETPVFMPVATAGAIRALPFERLAEIGYRIILSNTYHLYLRPGIDIIAKLNGLHNFIGWHGNILTDSGGFQVFSLSNLMSINDTELTFRSHIDGSKHSFTPESVMALQMRLGSDIIMPLDHPTPPGVGYREAQIALKRTTAWLKRSAVYLEQAQQRGDGGSVEIGAGDTKDSGDRQDNGTSNTPAARGQQQLFGIVQGNFYPTLRTQSAKQIVALELPGYAIGGMSVGEDEGQFLDILAHTAALLPDDKPRYLMGVGTPEYLLHAIAHGIDMFDCVYPTRIARHGTALTVAGKLDMHKGRFRSDLRPLDAHCGCNTCRLYTRAYIHHLSSRREIMAAILLSEHNLFFLNELCLQARAAIREQRYQTFMRDFLHRYTGNGE